MDPKIIITGRHLTETTRDQLSEKLGKLLQHSQHVVRIRLDLHEASSHDGEMYYTAKAVVEVRGPDLIASERSTNLYKSVHSVVDKLDRMLSERGRRSAEKRRHPHAIELPVELPKTSG